MLLTLLLTCNFFHYLNNMAAVGQSAFSGHLTALSLIYHHKTLIVCPCPSKRVLAYATVQEWATRGQYLHIKLVV